MVKHPINFLIAFLELLLSQFLVLEIGLLQFLQSEPHATNVGQIKSFIG